MVLKFLAMSKKFLFIASILLTIIVGAGLFWYYCCDCGDEQVAEPLAPLPDSSEAIDWQAVRNQINSNPPTLQFEPYQTESAFNQVSSIKLEEMIDYLENNQDGGLLVTGHADISGPQSLNIKLSQERAIFLKSVLVAHGIEEDKITTAFKGTDDPIADNSTPGGRAKNRRAVVIIK
jgi:outer membrane protein OmpA-like peptidoglycan-associated protein